MRGALLVLTAVLLAVPGASVGAKGLAAVRTRSAVIRGRAVGGGKAVGAGLLLLGWAAAMIAIAVLVVATLAARRG